MLSLRIQLLLVGVVLLVVDGMTGGKQGNDASVRSTQSFTLQPASSSGSGWDENRRHQSIKNVVGSLVS